MLRRPGHPAVILSQAVDSVQGPEGAAETPGKPWVTPAVWGRGASRTVPCMEATWCLKLSRGWLVPGGAFMTLLSWLPVPLFWFSLHVFLLLGSGAGRTGPFPAVVTD